MITRPLDLASRLRRPPRGYDWLFLVNVGMIVLLFTTFGSRFVLSPGLGIDFRLPEVPGASVEARPTSHVITVVNAGQIFVGDGLRSMDELHQWLAAQAKIERRPALLVRVSADVPAAVLARILGLAHEAGFTVTWAAEDTRSGAAAR